MLRCKDDFEPQVFYPAAKLLVVQWRSQTIDRLKTDENVLERFRQSSSSSFGDVVA